MRYRLFIFDFDGTLADSAAWMVETLNAAADQFGYRALPPEEMEALRGKDSHAIFRAMRLPPERLPEIVDHVRARAKEAAPAPLFSGIPEMLRDLHGRGKILAAVSSNSAEAVRRALGPLAGLFSVYDCDAAMFGKADNFRRVLAATGVSAGEAISIGDEVRDIEAARAAGIACGAVIWGYATEALLAAQAPDRLIRTPAEILALA